MRFALAVGHLVDRLGDEAVLDIVAGEAPVLRPVVHIQERVVARRGRAQLVAAGIVILKSRESVVALNGESVRSALLHVQVEAVVLGAADVVGQCAHIAELRKGTQDLRIAGSQLVGRNLVDGYSALIRHRQVVAIGRERAHFHQHRV